MWLVGYLFNNNGMGTWCWEAAHALADAGEPVTLLCSDRVVLPGATSIPVLRVAADPLPRGIARFNAPGGMLSRHGPRVVREAIARLATAGTPVERVLLNSTEFVDETVGVPQLATAWASGVSSREYASRLVFHLRGRPRDILRSTLATVGWWRRDWFGFTHVDIVLAVTERLTKELRSHGVPATTLFPCTHVSTNAPVPRADGSRVRLVTAAVDLEEPRKRVSWMLEALRGFDGHCELTLIGSSSARLRAMAAGLKIPVVFTDRLPREAAMSFLSHQDVFLFASVLDDWGYVVTEAMARGLAVVAPDLPPFDEILGTTGALYPAESQGGFCRALAIAVAEGAGARDVSWRRASAEFSRGIFSARLREILAERIPHT